MSDSSNEVLWGLHAGHTGDAHRKELGIEPPTIKIQVKSTEDSVGDPEVSQLFGKVADGEFGVLVTLGTFSKQARDFADSKRTQD